MGKCTFILVTQGQKEIEEKLVKNIKHLKWCSILMILIN